MVDLGEDHIQAPADAYPLPPYYADPQQMRDSIGMGIIFNIIDTSRGEKADLVPLTIDPRYRKAFKRRLRQMVELADGQPFEIWCARPEDIIVGKLMAWAEGRSRKHETDIYEMMVFHHDSDSDTDTRIRETARRIKSVHLWQQSVSGLCGARRSAGGYCAAGRSDWCWRSMHDSDSDTDTRIRETARRIRSMYPWQSVLGLCGARMRHSLETLHSRTRRLAVEKYARLGF